MNNAPYSKLLFIINENAGNITKDWAAIIADHLPFSTYKIELFFLPRSCNSGQIIEKIQVFKPEKVMAVGGDGTVKLVAESLLGLDIPLGIIPAGSANGLAKEIGLPLETEKAFNNCLEGQQKIIHLTRINNEYCIHLSDIGFNAFLIKKFEAGKNRGMWGYIKACWKALLNNPIMEVEIQVDHQYIKRKAVMIVIANATRYGSGALINPIGNLEDEFFELIVIRKISIAEIFKMMFSHKPFDPKKTELFQTNALTMKSRKKAYFQVDGEFKGKVNNISAVIIINALKIIVPA